MYLIVQTVDASEGYDDYNSTYDIYIGYTSTEELAQEIVKELSEKRKRLEYLKEIARTEKSFLIKDFPGPKGFSQMKIPRWEAGLNTLKITNELREERENIKKENTARETAYEAMTRAWEKLLKKKLEVLMLEKFVEIAEFSNREKEFLFNFDSIEESVIFDYYKIAQLSNSKGIDVL